MLLFPGGIQAKNQKVFKWISGDVVITATFDEGEFLTAVPENGQIEVRAVGRLKSGQYFSATKTVTVQN